MDLGTFHKEFGSEVERYCLHLCRGDKENAFDLMQDTYLRLLKYPPSEDIPLHKGLVLQSIKWAHYRNFHNKEKMPFLLSLDEEYKDAITLKTFLEDDEDFLENYQHNENSDYCKRLLNQLSKEEKDFIIEKFYLYKTLDEMGEKRGVSRQAIEQRVNRIIQKMRRIAVERMYFRE